MRSRRLTVVELIHVAEQSSLIEQVVGFVLELVCADMTALMSRLTDLDL
jgi:hypothetical protein